jgi:hypothetical protein
MQLQYLNVLVLWASAVHGMNEFFAAIELIIVVKTIRPQLNFYCHIGYQVQRILFTVCLVYTAVIIFVASNKIEYNGGIASV